MKMTPARRLSHELRSGDGEYLRYRRESAFVSLVAMSSLMAVALYQLGMLKHLPQPPSSKFDTKKVNGSAEAYSKFSVPDGVLGLGSYAATLGLAAMGGKHRAETHPWMPLALAGKSLVDIAQAGKMTRDSWVKHGAFSMYSLIAATAAFVNLPLVLPEALAALRRLRNRSNRA